MCRILSIEKKHEIKRFQNKKYSTKKLSSFNLQNITALNLYDEKNQVNSKDILLNNCDSSCNQNVVSCKREKSRIAAKNRRNQENENLSELYISLPVATQSKLLPCYDNELIGNFEKATIIKISAYVLNLYNSLSNIFFDNSIEFDKHPLVSLFSQSIFGLFWCETTSKLVFSSPGLARLTGLYWCNMIGMPRSSIIVEPSSQDSSNIIFLRFVMGTLKDRGIFTVNPQKTDNSKETKDLKSEKSESNNNQMKRDFIGKLPCSVWCLKKLGGGIMFNLIQPLIIKPKKGTHLTKVVQSHQRCPYRLPVFSHTPSAGKPQKINKFTSIHNLNTLATISVYGDFETVLGYKEENFSKSSLVSFFHFDDIAPVMKHVNELISGEKKIHVGIARICTPKVDKYCWSRYVLQINNHRDSSESTFPSHRSNVSQGESYSQQFVKLSNTLNNNHEFKNEEDHEQNSWLEARFSLCHYFQEIQTDYAAFPEYDNINQENDDVNITENDLSSVEDLERFLQICPNNPFEKSDWPRASSRSVVCPVDVVKEKMMFVDEKNRSHPHQVFPQHSSILLKELMRPIQSYCIKH